MTARFILSSAVARELDLLPLKPSPIVPDAENTSVVGITASGDLLYVCGGNRFSVIDFSDPLNPARLGFCLAPSASQAIVQGERAFIAAGSAGVHMADIANPSSPKLIKTFNTQGSALRVVDYQNLLFVADKNAIQVLQADEANLSSVVRLPLDDDWVGDIAFHSNYAYVAAASNLHILDLTNPEAPAVAGSIEAAITRIIIQDGFLYAVRGSRLSVYDLGDPLKPVEIGTNTATISPTDFAVRESYAFAGNWGSSSGISAFDVTTPSAPSVAGQIRRTLGPTANSFAILNDLLVYSEGKVNDLRLVQITEAHPQIISRLALPPNVSGGNVSVGRDTILARNYSIDVSDPEAPQIILTNSISAQEIIVQGDQAIVFGSDLFTCLLGGDGTLTKLGSLDLPISDPFEHISPARVGSLILAEGTMIPRPLYVVDVSTPATPELLSTYTGAGQITAVAADSSRVVVIGDRVPKFLSLTNPEAPSIIGEIAEVTFALGLHLAGDLLYISDASEHLLIYNVADIQNPALLGQTSVRHYGNTMLLADGHLYLLQPHNGMEIFDVRDPSAPTRVGGSSIPARDIATDGQHLYRLEEDEFVIMELIDSAAATPKMLIAIADGQPMLTVEGLTAPAAIEISHNLADWDDWESVSADGGAHPLHSPQSAPHTFYRLRLGTIAE